MVRRADSWNTKEKGKAGGSRFQADAASEGVKRGVELGYRVIEEYLRAGQRAAEQLNSSPYNWRGVADNSSELMETLVRNFNQMVPVWLELVNSLLRADLSQRPQSKGFQAGRSADATDNFSHSQSMPIELQSIHRVQVDLKLPQSSENRSLITLGLRSVDPKMPPLTDIRFVSSKGKEGGKMLVKIPDKQPAGTYSGVVVDHLSGETRGTLTIRVSKNQ
jgi:hypothetical protein